MLADGSTPLDAMSVTQLCRKVAQASGGFFGLGKKVSAEEEAMIAKIAARFEDAQLSASQLKSLKT